MMGDFGIKGLFGGKKKTKLMFATTPWRRMIGLLGRRHFQGILVLAPCHDIHTVGMRMPIDVAFFGKDGVVLRSEREVRPGSRLSCPGAYAVIERESSLYDAWPWEGDRLEIAINGEENLFDCEDERDLLRAPF